MNLINYKDMYKKMANPLTFEVVKKIVEEYLTSGSIDNYLKAHYCTELEKNYDFDSLPKDKQDKLLNNYYAFRNKFYPMFFNIWKNRIGNLSYDQIKGMVDKGIVGEDYYELRDYLINTPYIDNAQDFKKAITGNAACSKYSKDVFLDNGWEHFFSKGLSYPPQEKINVEHRLYINPLETDYYEMAYLFAEKCLTKNIPFYFKMDNGFSDDKIVIYSDTEHLKVYISLLDEIKKEHPNLISNTQKPPVLCGLIDNWIGYGSEPMQRGESYNSKRSHLIGMILDKAIGDKKGKYLGKKIKVNDEIVNKIWSSISLIGGKIGIDTNNFCFDIESRDKLFAYEDNYDLKDNPDFMNVDSNKII